MSVIKCCKDCTERHLACHDSCEKYLSEKKEKQDAMDRYRKETDGSRQLDVMGVDRRIKNFRKHGRSYGKV